MPEDKLNWSATTPTYTSNTGQVPVEPLNRRGWVVQERLLSPRTIF